MLDDWETEHFGDTSRDGTGDYDNDGISDLDEFLNDTDPASDEAPVADAGPDTNAFTGHPATIDGSDSYDPGNMMVTYDWSFIEVPVGSAATDDALSDLTSAKPVFVPDIDGVYRLSLIVNDGTSESIADEVIITSYPSNVAPNSDAGTDRNAMTDILVNIDGSGSADPDNWPQSMTYAWTFDAAPAGSALTDADIIYSDEVAASFIPDIDGTYILKLTVSDGDLTDEDTVQIIAVSFDVAPNADAGDDVSIILGETAALNGSGSNDPDNLPQVMMYTWRFVTVPYGSSMTNNDVSGAATVSPSFTPDIAGVYVLRIIVDDGLAVDSDNVVIAVSEPEGWYDIQWQHRQEISISSSITNRHLYDFPLLIRITDGANEVFSKARSNGDDILFTLSNGITISDHEIEIFDTSPGSEELVAWVRIPDLSSITDTTIYLYYGNAIALNQENPEGVWDSNYVMVQHLNEAWWSYYDSTANNNDANYIDVAARGAAGAIGNAVEFDGVDDYINIPDPGVDSPLDLSGSGPITLSAWVNARSSGGSGIGGILAKGGSAGWTDGYKFSFEDSAAGGGNCGPLQLGPSRAGKWNGPCTSALPLNTWVYVTFVYDASTSPATRLVYFNDTLDF
jgi:hypothetical protein